MHKKANVSIAYIGRDGRPITAEQWQKLTKDESNTIVRRFKNERLQVFVTWIGRCTLTGGKTIKHTKPFKIEVFNIITEDPFGFKLPKPKIVLDPTESQFCYTEVEAVALYEDFLVRYAGAEWAPGEGGKSVLIEKGNKFAPIDKAIPIAEDMKNPENFGIW